MFFLHPYYLQFAAATAEADRGQDAIHPAWDAVGERLRRELPQQLRDKLLANEVLENLSEVRKNTPAWKHEGYNHFRPHSSLGYLTPSEFAACRLRLRRAPWRSAISSSVEA